MTTQGGFHAGGLPVPGFHKGGQGIDTTAGASGLLVGVTTTDAADGRVMYAQGGKLASSAGLQYDQADGQLVLGAGSAAKPALIFGDDTTGTYRVAADVLGWATAGVGRWKIDATGMLLPVTDGAFDIGAAGGLRPRDVFVGGHVYSGAGSAGTPAFNFDVDPDNGMFRVSANVLGFATAGTDRWHIDASGHLVAATDGSFDIGQSAATRPRQIYTSSNITMGGTMVVGSLLGTLQTRGANNRFGLECPSGLFAYLMGNLTAAAATSATEADIVVGADANRSAGFVLSVNNNMTSGTGGSRLAGVTFDGRLIALAPNSAATDSDLPAGSWTAYLNEAGNLLTFKVKYAAGTVKTGSVAVV